MEALFDRFPCLTSGRLVIHKMTENDVDDLNEITANERVYRYIPPFLYKKSRGNLLAAIRNCGERDFDKKKRIIAGVYEIESMKMIGLAEIFDYKKRANQATIGYRINEAYWHRGIAIEIVGMLTKYLLGDVGLSTVTAFVMPENIYSSKALIKNGYARMDATATGVNWGGRGAVTLDVYALSAPSICIPNKK